VRGDFTVASALDIQRALFDIFPLANVDLSRNAQRICYCGYTRRFRVDGEFDHTFDDACAIVHCSANVVSSSGSTGTQAAHL